jgi:predicted Zn-dependent peptidase
MSPTAPERHALDNGIQIVVEPMAGAQSVSVAFRFPYGAKDDPPDRLGLARVAEETVFKGTPARDARAVFDAFDALGVRRGSATDVETTDFRAQVLPRHFREAIALYGEVLRTASFPDDQVDISKALSLEELKRLEDSPFEKVMYLTMQAGLGDPLGRIPLGEPESVATISPNGVRSHWSNTCRPNGLLISVAGGVEASEVFDAIEDAFGDWPDDGGPPPPPPHPTVAAKSVHYPKESEQEHIGMLFGAVPRGHELYYAGQLAVAVLSGSGSSRLFTEVREKRGLVYHVGAYYRARRGGGLIALYAGTTAERADETLVVCRREIERLAEDVTPEELERAKTVLKGRLFTTGDLADGRSGSLLEDLFLDGNTRSVGHIARGVDSVTLDQIPTYLEAFPATPTALATLGPRPLESEAS